ncbi:MAG: hypothetical protein AAGG50_03815 [Bacteroidota bacterium]
MPAVAPTRTTTPIRVLASGHRQTPSAFRARRVAVAATPEHIASFADTTGLTVERYERGRAVA